MFEDRMKRNQQPKAKRGYSAKCLNLKLISWQRDYFLYVF